MELQRTPDLSQANLNPHQMKQVHMQGGPATASNYSVKTPDSSIYQGLQNTGANLQQEAPEEKRHPHGVSFMEVHPTYKREDDVWERQMAMRSLEEALRGDVSVPMPKPVVLVEDYDHYREGKYVKDDCFMA